MSDKVYWRDVYDAADKRISELEKYRKADEDEIVENTNTIAELKEKVASLDLEKKLKIDYMLKMNQLVKNDKAHQALYDKIFKELNELKEKFDNHNCYKNWTRNIKVHDLDELEGKKESYKDLPKISNDGTYHIIEFGEDSGGEKSHIENFSDVEKSKIVNNSKPPEPIFDDEEIWGDEPRENEIIRNEIRYKDGFSNDKVYDPKEYKIVKREDLQTWKRILIREGWTQQAEYIEEEYGIE